MSILSFLGIRPKLKQSVVLDICPLSVHGSAHDEELIDKTVFPSSYEQMDKDSRRSFEEYWTHGDNHFAKKIVFVFKCKTCGRIRKDTEWSRG